MPLPAQPNAPAGNGTNRPAAVTDSAQASNPIEATGSNYEKNPPAKTTPDRNENSGAHSGSLNPAGKKLLGLGIHVGGESQPGGIMSEMGDYIVAIVAIVGSFVFLLAVIAMGLYARERRSKRLHETLCAMIDKGIPIPPELFGTQSRHPVNQLRMGLFWIGLGTGFLFIGGNVGFILLFIGAASLIAWLVERKNKSGDQPPNP